MPQNKPGTAALVAVSLVLAMALRILPLHGPWFLLNPDWVVMVNTIAADPARYLNEKITAIRPRTKEMVTLAIIRLASLDPATRISLTHVLYH